MEHNSKTLNKISLRSYNLQGKLTGEQKLKKIEKIMSVYNFSPGPSKLHQDVIDKVEASIQKYDNTGKSGSKNGKII